MVGKAGNDGVLSEKDLVASEHCLVHGDGRINSGQIHMLEMK